MKQTSFLSSGFLPSLDCQLEEHLSDASLSVKKLLRLVGMSRTDLHRKLHQAVGMSTTEYIRAVRLKRAADIMSSEPDKRITEVAESVGFASLGYFSKAFKQVFHCCPKQFRRQQL
jgi:AraC-like DNA-binding protein